jgi:hypothetical protein
METLMVSAVNKSGAGVITKTRRGVTGPVVQCVACRGRITDATAGVALWQVGKEAPPAFAHVGGCCRRVEDFAPAALWRSRPLSAWLIFWANGCKMKGLKAARRAQLLAGGG